MFVNKSMEEYYPCCGKSICSGCVYSFRMSGNMGICPFCNSDRDGKTGEDVLEDIMKRVEANDPPSIAILAKYYYHGIVGVQQDQAKAMELYARATELGLIKANCLLADIYHKGGDLKKARFHVEAAAMAGHEVSRNNLGILEAEYGTIDRAIKHCHCCIRWRTPCYATFENMF